MRGSGGREEGSSLNWLGLLLCWKGGGGRGKEEEEEDREGEAGGWSRGPRKEYFV